jgi:hemerythrin-like metal-binding protein
MFWKETLRIGVDAIDAQHMEIFEKTKVLFKETSGSGADKKQKCVSTILFLKEYAVKHFADEEAYMRSVGYKDFDEHQKLHVRFVKNLLMHEQKMVASDFSASDVNGFTGMLVTWLLYHVADADQKIKTSVGKPPFLQGYSKKVHVSVCDTLSKLAGLNVNDIKVVDAGTAQDSAFVVEIALRGGISGSILVAYPLGFVRGIIELMMGYVPERIGEMEASALFEISDIITNNVCAQLAMERNVSYEVASMNQTTRTIAKPDETVRVDTGIGVIEVDFFF